MEFKKGVYRHFKGQCYEVLDLARHSETEELFVVYRALYGDRSTWIRPADNFFARVEREGRTQPRFSYVSALADFPGKEQSEP